ncbi:XRE family transcriptional regulator [Mycolicibacterium setense]|uniref:XRE family transcriptional regulator n=1 Tax=Mycolicibacterium setense TaxID=431269 RepID=UPI001F33D0E7|nr:XRE family transcriptional regulator [Mycolicibacterium setense]
MTLLGCARCGRTDVRLRRTSPEGRCCNWCAIKNDRRPCARCGEPGLLTARRKEGAICRRCYNNDPEFLQQCAGCGRTRPPNVRRADGTVLCQGCSLPPPRQCSQCGQTRQTHALTAEGPLCRACYSTPARRCGLCGEINEIQARATDTTPDICRRCYRNIGECVACGRTRAGGKYRGGPFHCISCWPMRPRHCHYCGEYGTACATWPLGTICRSCYQRRLHNPTTCATCQRTAVMVGLNTDGKEICTACSGADLDFACKTCGAEGMHYSAGKCARCVAASRVTDLLSDDTGQVPTQLQPLVDALATAHPNSILTWLRVGKSSRLLAGLVADQQPITHELLDDLNQDGATRYIRQLLVATGVLPSRPEQLTQLMLWATRTTAALPSHQARIIRPFAEWRVVRDARARSRRRNYTDGAAASDRAKILTAIDFLDWIDQKQYSLEAIGQPHLEEWLAANPTSQKHLVVFAKWLTKQRLAGAALTVPSRPTGPPSRLLPEDELHQQLRRCLTDETLPLEVRVAGALIRLYAPMTVRMIELTTDRYHADEHGSFITFDRNPVLLPPSLARLIEQLIERRSVSSMVHNASDEIPRYLFPGRPPSRPIHPRSLQQRLTRYGLPVIHARNAAMIASASTLPPPVMTDLFGIAPSTAYRWAEYAQNSWAAYLEATEHIRQSKAVQP